MPAEAPAPVARLRRASADELVQAAEDRWREHLLAQAVAAHDDEVGAEPRLLQSPPRPSSAAEQRTDA